MTFEEKKKRQRVMQLRHSCGQSMACIAKDFTLSQQQVSNILRAKYKKLLCEQYPQLQKISGRDYNREKVRIRDKLICKDCGRKWKEGERRFDVHHKDFDKDKTKGYDLKKEWKNLVTLDHSCHLKRHGKHGGMGRHGEEKKV